ncbi:MAG: WG repeat-containing protein [Cellulosilyticaceae bacterium]
MKRRYFSGLVVLLLCISMLGNWGLRADEMVQLFPALTYTKAGNFYGYINPQGKWVIPPTYESAMAFDEGFGIVQKDDLFGAVNGNGKIVIPLKYQSLGQPKDGLVIFTDKEGMGVLKTNGKVLTKKRYSYVADYQDDLALVMALGKEGQSQYGYIDQKGKEVIKPQYSNAYGFEDAKALVSTEAGKYQLIDQSGKVITAIDYPVVYGYQDDRMIYSEQVGGLMGYLDSQGKVVIPAQFKTAEAFEDSVAVAGTAESFRGQQGLIDAHGQWIYKPIYNEVRYLGDGRVALGKASDRANPEAGSLFAIGDTKGKILTDFVYNGVSDYEEDKASAYDTQETFFIDLAGRPIADLPRVKGAGTMVQEGQVIRATIDEHTSYLTPDGKVIYSPNEKIILSEGKAVTSNKYKPDLNYLAYYPQVVLEGNGDVALLINQKLLPVPIETLKKQEDFGTYTYDSGFDIQFYKDNLLIPNIWNSIYYFGGAHPLPGRRTPVIDLGDGAFYELDDLFLSNSHWKSRIEQIMTEQAQKDPAYEGLFSDAKITIAPNQAFYVDENNLYIYYAPYEIGPYAMGFVTFKIPYTELKGMINEQGGFWRAYHQ